MAIDVFAERKTASIPDNERSLPVPVDNLLKTTRAPIKLRPWNPFPDLAQDLATLGLVANDVVVHLIEKMEPETVDWLLDRGSQSSFGQCLIGSEVSKSVEGLISQEDMIRLSDFLDSAQRPYVNGLRDSFAQQFDPYRANELTEMTVGNYEQAIRLEAEALLSGSTHNMTAFRLSRIVGRMQGGQFPLVFIDWNIHVITGSENGSS